MPSFLEKKAKSLGKTLFIEDSVFTLPSSDIEHGDILKESDQRIVRSQGIHLLAVLRNVPVTRFVRNRNGRIYPRELFLRLLHNGTAENTLCMDGHPADDVEATPSDCLGVWRSFKVNADNCTADLYLNNTEKARTILYTLLNGGSMGLSSVGYGELLPDDGETVNPETFEIERLADIVCSPSQGTFAREENVDMVSLHPSVAPIQESVSSAKLEESTALSSKQITKEDMSLIPFHRSQARAALKEARAALKTKDLERLREAHAGIQEIQNDFPSDADLEAVRKELGATAEKISETLDSAIEDSKKMEADYSELQERYKGAVELANQLKEQANRMRGVITSLGGDEATGRLAVLESMQADLQSAVTERQKVIAENSKLRVERKALFTDTNTIRENYNKLLADTKKMDEQFKSVLLDNRILIHEREKRMLPNQVQLLKDRELMEKDLKEARIYIEAQTKDLLQLREDKKNLIRDKEAYKAKLKEALGYQGGDDSGLKNSLLPFETDSGTQELNNADYATLENARDLKPQDRIPGVMRESANEARREIDALYFKESARYPVLKRAERKIRGARSLLEAIDIVDAYLNENYDDAIPVSRMTESVHQDESWTGGRF